jgi:hypothetical protein
VVASAGSAATHFDETLFDAKPTQDSSWPDCADLAAKPARNAIHGKTATPLRAAA